MTELNHSIELPLIDLLIDKEGNQWGKFITPSLKLSRDKNVGIILGPSGCGKSVLANQFITEALMLGFSIHYRDHFDTQSLVESNAVSLTDTAFNKLSEIARNNIEQFHFLPEGDAIPDAKARMLLVIDEVHYQLESNKLLQSELRHYIDCGGMILLIDQDSYAIDNLLKSASSLGFKAVSGKSRDLNRKSNSEYSSELCRLVGSFHESTYSWLCSSNDGLATGYSSLSLSPAIYPI